MTVWNGHMPGSLSSLTEPAYRSESDPDDGITWTTAMYHDLPVGELYQCKPLWSARGLALMWLLEGNSCGCTGCTANTEELGFGDCDEGILGVC